MRKKMSAVEARKHLGELLEGVFYRGDEVVIERAGKTMGVVVPLWLYQNIERSRDRVMAFAEANWEHNKDVPTEVLGAEIAQAVREVREERRRQKDTRSA